MNRIAHFAILSLILAANCTTAPKKSDPPPVHLRNLIKTPSSQDEMKALDSFLSNYKSDHSEAPIQWWADYHRASHWREWDPAESCKIYQTLSQDSEFPLKDLAFLRSTQVCSLKKEDFERVYTLEASNSPLWLRPEAVMVALEVGRKEKNKAKIMELAFEASHFVDHHKEKTALVQESLEIAKELKDQTWIEKVQTRLYVVAPRFTPSPARNELFKVAHDFRKAREFRPALKIYQQILKDKTSTLEERGQALDGIRLAYRQEGNREKQLAATKQVARFYRDNFKKEPKSATRAREYLEHQLMLARALWTEGQVDSARRVLKETETRLADKAPLTEIFWLRSRMAEEKGFFDDALEWNQKAMSSISENHSQWETLMWQQAWLYRKLKNYDQAIAILARLNEKLGPNSNSKYSFWQARIRRENRQEAQAAIEFQNVIASDPFGYYGIMAHRELGLTFDPIRIPPLIHFERPSFVDKDQHALLMWLMGVNEIPLVKSLLDSLSQDRSLAKISESDRKRFLKFRAQVGDYLSLFIHISQWPEEEKRELLDQNPELIFPQPYFDTVAKAAKNSGISAEFVYAIMRQESAFNPRARSPADALGLMQLTPLTAKKVAKTRKLKFNKDDQLYLPEYNIRLGAAFLGQLMKKFDDQFILTVASYNASEKAVLGWIQTRFQNDPVEFIEDIPYAETMGYIKLVLRNMVFYMRMNSMGAPVAFPEWCLEGLHSFKR